MKTFLKFSVILTCLGFTAAYASEKPMTYSQLEQAATQGAKQLVQVDPSITLSQAKQDLLIQLISANGGVQKGICCALPDGKTGVLVDSHGHPICVSENCN